MDWGVAKLRERLESARGTAGEASSAEGEGRAEGDTAAGTVLGTPGFMAPEQEAGRPDLVDERTDVFALGALLRRLLSGIETPKPLEAVIRKATTPDPAARYAGAAAVAEDVRRFLDARAVEAYPEGPLERGARIFRKYGTAILLVLAYLAMRVLFILLR
jgi:serine/threonine protein kinase